MKISKLWRQSMLALAWLSQVGAAGKLPAQPGSPARPLTIERIADERERSETRPREMTWSPDGKSVSFIRTAPKAPRTTHPSANAAGPASEVWSIDTVDGKEKLLVSSSRVRTALGSEPLHFAPEEDEIGVKRRRLAQCLWAPGGHALLLAARVSLAWFDLDTHTSRPLATNGKDVSNPAISPDGRFVSFIQDHTLWLADVTTGASHIWTPEGSNNVLEGEPDWSYRHELGLHKGYWWSPDSSSIAWLETDDRAVDKYPMRTDDGEEQSIAYPKPGGAIPKVRLLVRTVSGGKTVPIILGGDTDVYIPRVQWLPDGKHLAIERLSRSQKFLELLLADPATGKVQSILTEKDDYWINLSDDLHFLRDSRRFLWSSERSGDRHLYLYDISGRQIAQLTHGHWEVTSLVGVDEKAGTAYFTATEASPLERPLYRVNLDGSGFARITHDKGTHNAVLSCTGDAFLDIWSDRMSPPRPALLRVDGSKIGSISDKVADSMAADQTAPIEFLTVKTHLGLDLNAWMMKPPDFDPARHYPAIFYVAGGPGEQVVRDVWGGDISLWFSLMAHKGYVIFALDNRGTSGRGHLFEEPVHLRFSATEMADVRDGVLYLHSQPWIDKGRIGICGWGYGGFLALHGMLDRPLMYKAGFAGSPIADWHLYDAVFTERYLEDPVRNQDGWLASSPVENAKFLNAPLLLAQATLDERIHLENSLGLLDELLDKGKYADILLFPDRQDLFEDQGARLILFGRLTDFFLKNL
jgi:dipeptidyl-peptidase-4